MFRDKIRPEEFSDWKCIYETSIESEARLVQAFLQNSGLKCEVLSKKDSAFSSSFGHLSSLFVYVAAGQEEEAGRLLEEWKSGATDVGDFNEEGADTEEVPDTEDITDDEEEPDDEE